MTGFEREHSGAWLAAGNADQPIHGCVLHADYDSPSFRQFCTALHGSIPWMAAHVVIGNDVSHYCLADSAVSFQLLTAAGDLVASMHPPRRHYWLFSLLRPVRIELCDGPLYVLRGHWLDLMLESGTLSLRLRHDNANWKYYRYTSDMMTIDTLQSLPSKVEFLCRCDTLIIPTICVACYQWLGRASVVALE